MFTVKNYAELRKNIDFTNLPAEYADLDDFVVENADLYGEDADIDAVIDGYLQQLNDRQVMTVAKKDTSKPAKKQKTVKSSPKTTVKTKSRFSERFTLPRNKIHTDPRRFQGRDKEYSEDTVRAIVTNGFDKNLSPITVWLDEADGKYYVISGHSRWEASRRLYESGDTSLKEMPVKQFLGTDEEAIDYAVLESNRSSTEEGLKSDIKAYKRAVDKGWNRARLLTIFRPESRMRKLRDLSYLNPDGKFLQNMGTSSEKHFPYLERNAQWAGQIRSTMPQLTNQHEDEMFNYLYGTSKKNLSITKDKFFDLINTRVSQVDFNADKPLNLTNIASVNPLTNPLTEQIRELEKEMEQLVKEQARYRELIIQARKSVEDEIMAPRFEAKISDINKVLLRKAEEIQRLQGEIGKVKRMSTIDLFSADNNTDKIKTGSCPPVDDKGNLLTDKAAQQQIKTCVASETPTHELHSDGKGGYTAERKKLHNEIVATFKRAKPCIVRKQPIVILTGGAPGSGKSHFLKKYARWVLSDKVLHIDTDEVRAKLPEYKGWNADNTHEESSHITKRIIQEIGVPCKTDVVYDGTMNKAKKYLPLVDMLKGMGYKVFVVYMQVPKSVSQQRVLERYQRTGRFVPTEVIDEIYENGLEAYEQVIKKADGYVRVNGVTSQIIEQGGMKIPEDRKYFLKPNTDDPGTAETTFERYSGYGKKTEPTPKYKVGDQVMVINDMGADYTATVQEVNGWTGTEHRYEVKTSDGNFVRTYDSNMAPADNSNNTITLNTITFTKVKQHKGHHILLAGKGDYWVWDGKKADQDGLHTIYQVGLDDSKRQGQRKNMSTTVKDAEDYIDYLTNGGSKSGGNKKPKPTAPSTGSAGRPTKAQSRKSQSEIVNRVLKMPATMTADEVIRIGKQLNEKRGIWGEVDAAKAAKKRLAPTRNNLLRWVQRPGEYDLIGVDVTADANPTLVAREVKKANVMRLFGL